MLAAWMQISMHILSYVTTAQSSILARTPYIVVLPLNENANLQVCMYCMHAQKEVSKAPRTHFRACKVSKFSGGVPPDHPRTVYYGPRILYLPWATPILSVALAAGLPWLEHFRVQSIHR